jgi:hypothetical protein
MKSLEEFKAARKKIDPSTHKMSAHQWQQAYAAYRSSRRNVGSGGSSSAVSGRRKRKSSHAVPAGMRGEVSVSAPAQLRASVRAESAYAELRLLINLIAWVVLGAVVMLAVIQVVQFSSVLMASEAILSGVTQALGVVLLKLIAHVLIDIPDIALYRAKLARRSLKGDESSPSTH